MMNYEDIERLAKYFGEEEVTDDRCELCFRVNWEHEDACPFSANNRFFDEEFEYGLEECE